MLKEFRSFIMRGNVVDLAVAFIMGGAFGAIVSSLVKDIIMPVVGLLLGQVDFTNIYLTLKPAPSGGPFKTLADAQAAGAVTMNIGMFLNLVITFLIVAFTMYMLVKAMNQMKKPAPAAAPTTKDCPYCFSSISIKATRCPNCTSELK